MPKRVLMLQVLCFVVELSRLPQVQLKLTMCRCVVSIYCLSIVPFCLLYRILYLRFTIKVLRFLFISQASVQPFKVGVHFSNDEYASANLNMFALGNVDTMYNDGEFLKAPGGIIGMYCKRLIIYPNYYINYQLYT